MGCLNYSFKNVLRRSSLLGKHGEIAIVLYTGKIMTSIDLTIGINFIELFLKMMFSLEQCNSKTSFKWVAITSILFKNKFKKKY